MISREFLLANLANRMTTHIPTTTPVTEQDFGGTTDHEPEPLPPPTC